MYWTLPKIRKNREDGGDMNERTIFKRRIQQLSQKIASDYDFTLYKRTFLIKEESDIVCMIVFDFPPTAMQFHVAVQPLYIPSERLHITVGYNIQRPSLAQKGYWGSDPEYYDCDINEITETIRNEVLPFFQTVSTPLKLIDYLQNDSSKRIRVAPIISKLHVAYSLLMTRQYDAALPYFNAVRNDLSQYTIESANKQLATIEKIISMIEKKDYYEISVFLKQTITDVKTVCGLV